MISTMDMATGQWERGDTAPDTAASGDSATPSDAYAVPPLAYAGLSEHVAVRPRHAGMPPALATQDLEVFLCRMTDSAH